MGRDLGLSQLPYPNPTSVAASAVMRRNVKVDTKPEVRVRSLLHRQGFRFRKNLLLREAGFRVRPDIVFPKLRLAVFIDGCFWHRCPLHGSQPRSNPEYWQQKLDRNVERDAMVNRELRSAGWTVLRIWEHSPPDEAVEEIQAMLQSLSRTSIAA